MKSIISLLVFAALWAGQVRAQVQVSEAYEEVLKEYNAKRTTGIGSLVDAAKVRLEAIKKERMQAADLKAVNSLVAVIRSLEKPPHSSEANDGLPEDAKAVLVEFSKRMANGIAGLNQIYLTRFEAVKTGQLKAGNLEEANLASEKVAKLTEEMKALTLLLPDEKPMLGKLPKKEEPILIDALVDGSSELHVLKEGLRWVQKGSAAKPGLFEENKRQATYVNGKSWIPIWHLEGSRGADVSDVYPIATAGAKVLVELIGTSSKRGGKNEDKGSLNLQAKEDHMVIGIPDPAFGARWYRIRISESAGK